MINEIKIGDAVFIIDGPAEGQRGIVTDMLEVKSKIKIAINASTVVVTHKDNVLPIISTHQST